MTHLAVVSCFGQNVPAIVDSESVCPFRRNCQKDYGVVSRRLNRSHLIVLLKPQMASTLCFCARSSPYHLSSCEKSEPLSHLRMTVQPDSPPVRKYGRTCDLYCKRRCHRSLDPRSPRDWLVIHPPALSRKCCQPNRLQAQRHPVSRYTSIVACSDRQRTTWRLLRHGSYSKPLVQSV